MSWQRQVKFLYEICLLVFMFIMWSIVQLMFFRQQPDYRILIISMATVLFIDYLYLKKSRNVLAAGIPYIIALGIIYLIYKDNILFVILNSVYMLLPAFIIYKNEEEDPYYSEYVYAFKKEALILILCGAVVTACGTRYWMDFIRLYIFYVLIGIVTLRESRLYFYDLRDKRTVLGNILTASALIILSFEKVFNSIIKLFSYVFKMAGYPIRAVLNLIVDIFIIVLGYPVLFIGEWLKSIIGKLPRQQQKKAEAAMYKKNTLEMLRKVQNNGFYMSKNTEIVIEVLILLAAVLLIIKLVNRRAKSGLNITESGYEEREKIYKDSRHKKNTIARIMHSIFKKVTIKECILDTYKNFEKEADKKQIFKKCMTPTQLARVYSTIAKDKASLYDMKNIYNEVKFSGHDVTSDQLQKIKKDFSCILQNNSEKKL